MAKRNTYTPEYKAKIVIEILEGEQTISEIASREGINVNQLKNWKKEFLENASLRNSVNCLKSTALRCTISLLNRQKKPWSVRNTSNHVLTTGTQNSATLVIGKSKKSLYRKTGLQSAESLSDVIWRK